MAGFGEFGRKMQTDVSDSVAALAAQGIVDPQRVCIVGASYGGYAALAGVTLQHGFYRCAVSVAGISHPGQFLQFIWKNEGREGKEPAFRYWKNYLGVESNQSSAYDFIAPVALAAKADAPVLLIHGDKDTVVPIEQSKDMERALKAAGKPVEFVHLKAEDHWLSRSETRLQMLRAAVAFVEKHNPPRP